MEKLLRPEDIAQRYGVTTKTARSYMRRMRHQEHPLTVTEAAVLAWDAKRTVDPDAPAPVKHKKTKAASAPAVTRIPRYKEVFG